MEAEVWRSGQRFQVEHWSVRAIWILVDPVWNVNRLVPELRFAQCFACFGLAAEFTNQKPAR